MQGQRGFTLVELLIVVALIAILASVAVYLGSKQISSARSSEVPALFAEFHNRQNQYKVEQGQGRFLSTGSNESDYWPASPPTNSSRTFAPIPDTWRALNMKPPKTSLYCSYVAIAGDANDGSNIGGKAAAFSFTTPPANWYYLLAECNFDGDSAVNSFYFASSVNVHIAEEKPGR